MTDNLAVKQKRAVKWTVLALFVAIMLAFVAIFMKVVGTGPDLKAQLEVNNVLYFSTPRLLSDIELTRHDGEAFTSDQFEGKWDVINFGYTYCPDICPTNMADMNIAHKQLTELGLEDQVRFWMVSVDPARDTVKQLSLYVPYFNEAFIGLTGEDDQISTLATQLSAVYYQEGEGEGYTVAHSDNYAIIDPNGHFVALMRPPHKPSHISDSISLLLAN